jgi:hypothetical protein
MNKIPAGKRPIMLKTVCAAMILILGGSLFAAGAMGFDGCGLKCCCHSGPGGHLQPSAEKQMRAPMACCSGVPFSPCDLQSAQPFELPEIIAASSRGDLSGAGGPSIVLADVIHQHQPSGAKFNDRALDLKFHSPPKYLQNLSFLI